MKKILIFCMFAGFMMIGAMPFVHAADTVGAQCSQDGVNLSDGGRYPVDCASHHFSNAQICAMYCDDGKLLYGIETCNPGFYQVEPYIVPPDLYKQCVTKAVACNKSGGRWNVNYCDCGGNDMAWNDTTMRCERSAEYDACRSAANTSWDSNFGICVCQDSLHYQWSGAECIPLPGMQECNDFAQKSDFKGKVKWNSLSGICECTHEPDGNVITNPDDWTINVFGTACVKKASVLRREEFAANKPAADAKVDAIKQKISELNGISDKMGRSHWKNADGKFNTARLASDSVAGVVLGTVGGVITSNVIKKNQIKGGFEDINCVIGGQRVAGFADQFNVGIQ